MLVQAMIVRDRRPVVFLCSTGCRHFRVWSCALGRAAFRRAAVADGAPCPLLEEGGTARDGDHQRR